MNGVGSEQSSNFTDQVQEIRTLARNLLNQHGLPDWTFAFNNRKRSLGQCVYRHRTIELTIHFALRNCQEEILDTLLHEIAMPWLDLDMATTRCGRRNAWRLEVMEKTS